MTVRREHNVRCHTARLIEIGQLTLQSLLWEIIHFAKGFVFKRVWSVLFPNWFGQTSFVIHVVSIILLLFLIRISVWIKQTHFVNLNRVSINTLKETTHRSYELGLFRVCPYKVQAVRVKHTYRQSYLCRLVSSWTTWEQTANCPQFVSNLSLVTSPAISLWKTRERGELI